MILSVTKFTLKSLSSAVVLLYTRLINNKWREENNKKQQKESKRRRKRSKRSKKCQSARYKLIVTSNDGIKCSTGYFDLILLLETYAEFFIV